MEITQVPGPSAVNREDNLSKSSALIDRYGCADFVDAVQNCQFERRHRKHLGVYHVDTDSFWEDVEKHLETHAVRP